jgi:predicted component of viral defense system (DUF524 family)
VSEDNDVALEIKTERGRSVGQLKLSLLPDTSPSNSNLSPLQQLDNESSGSNSLASVQLLEGCEYLFELSVPGRDDEHIRIEPGELFSQGDPPTEGRLRTKEHIGLLEVSVLSDEDEIGRCYLNVRSRKLNYDQHYRWMVEDLAREMTEVLMQRFGPTAGQFKVDESTDARTLYQRFAFLKSIISGGVFEDSLRLIINKPYQSWEEEQQTRRPGQGLPASSSVAKQMNKPGARMPTDQMDQLHQVDSLPRTFDVSRSHESLDNPPNRFVKFVLQRWRTVIQQIRSRLQEEDRNAPIERGIRETTQLIDQLDMFLSNELFRNVGPLKTFPTSNQVLQKREGYRDVLRAYIQFESAALLSWQGGQDVYGAGQKDVAEMYEYWVYMKLARGISDLMDQSFHFSDLIEKRDDGLHLKLRRDQEEILSGIVEKPELGRRFRVEFHFNETFSDKNASWSHSMRPDCSLRIAPLEGEQESFFYGEDVWVHFDAKYRYDVNEDKSDEEEQMIQQTKGVPVRDLNKMHTYRDAIRRSSGAYVIYPGDEGKETYQKYHEILPGLGAFSLRPTDPNHESDVRSGLHTIRSFIDEILEHIADQRTEHERARYWEGESYNLLSTSDTKETQVAQFLDEPPEDTIVLLGYVKNEDHLTWISNKRLYNLRADDQRKGSVDVDSQELAATFLLLYNEDERLTDANKQVELPELWRIVDAPRLMTKEQMKDSGYPNPSGDQYFCLHIQRIQSGLIDSMEPNSFRNFRRSKTSTRGRPLAVTWSEIVENII